MVFLLSFKMGEVAMAKKIPLGLNIIKWLSIIAIVIGIGLFFLFLLFSIIEKEGFFLIITMILFPITLGILINFYIVRGINKKKKYGYYLIIISFFISLFFTFFEMFVESLFYILFSVIFSFLIVVYVYKKRSYFGIKGIIK